MHHLQGHAMAPVGICGVSVGSVTFFHLYMDTRDLSHIIELMHQESLSTEPPHQPPTPLLLLLNSISFDYSTPLPLFSSSLQPLPLCHFMNSSFIIMLYFIYIHAYTQFYKNLLILLSVVHMHMCFGLTTRD